MTTKQCTVCESEFVVRGKAKTCSSECSKAAFLAYKREWRRQPHVIATEREYAIEYKQRPDVKEANREREKTRPARTEYNRVRRQSPAYKEYMKEYGHKPKRMNYQAEYLREYRQRPEVRAALRERWNRPGHKEQKRLYGQRPDAKASKIARAQTPEYKAKASERYQRPDVKQRQRNHLREYRKIAKAEALAFARELLAGKYPDLIPTDHVPCLLYTATCRETGKFLYIGVTESWELRQKQHAVSHKGALWLPTAEITMEVYSSRTLAMAAEMVAIKKNEPVFNVVHNPLRERVAA